MAPSSTEINIQKVLAGDHEAYSTIVRQYQEEVWRIVAFALRSPAATEDLVQEVFVQAYERLDRYTPGTDLGAWLRTIARNRVRNELRRSSRENERLHRYRDHILEHWEEETPAGEREDRLRTALADCREKLPDASNQALELRYRQALDFGQIANQLDRTTAAARQLLQRARGTLRGCIEERMARA